MVEELSRLNNVCLCMTSRTFIFPLVCKTFDVPLLSDKAAHDTFYRIHKVDEWPNLVDNVLAQLDLHPLSITLLATVARHNRWDANQLTTEWKIRRRSMLEIGINRSLAATIKLSLTSPIFQELGPGARELLEVIAFFPQGVDENSVDWLFATITDRNYVFDMFCTLSLTYRSNGFIAMLAPLRDHISLKNPELSSLFHMVRRRYFNRMAVKINPDEPNFGETRWITLEDVNVEHLLDISTTVDPNLDGVWDACANFIEHLSWHKRQPTILQARIEGLPDDHHSKPKCLLQLARLSCSLTNFVECKRLASHALTLWRERWDLRVVAQILGELAVANQMMNLPKEGIPQAEEALEICEWLDDTVEQARCLITLAILFRSDDQLDAAEDAAVRAVGLLPEKGQQYRTCESHEILGYIYRSKGETKRAIHHFEVAVAIASTFNWHESLLWDHYELAQLFLGEGRFEDTQAHAEYVKSHAVDGTYYLGCATELQAWVLYGQHRLEEARTEALRAADIFDKLGASTSAKKCGKLLGDIEKELNTPVASASNCELLRT